MARLSHTELRTRLAELQHDDGGFGSVATAESNTEATAYALLAGAVRQPARARDWLISRITRSGAFAMSEAASGESWATSVALLALAESPDRSEEVRLGAEWLTRAQGRAFDWRVRFMQLMTPRERRVDQNLSLVGWSWHPSAQSWVEPTALAILALKKVRTRVAPLGIDERIIEGEALILDRMCPGGGWNYGNKRVLDFQLEPFADATGFALLALDLSQRDAISQSLARLETLLEHERSGLALALAVLAFQRHGLRRDRWRAELARWAAHPPDRLETRACALALLALEENLGALVS